MEELRPKLIYVIAQGHSGSTLVDSILGSHPEMLSSGELRYLNWQLERTQSKRGSKDEGSCCSCGQDFRDCKFWSKVFSLIEQRANVDVLKDPKSFDTSHFGQYYFRESEHSRRSLADRFLGYSVREWLEMGRPVSFLGRILPKMEPRINNNWLLYELMAEASGRKVIIDSSKNLLFALLLQQSRPTDVWFLFLHRDPRGLAYSQKKLAAKKGRAYIPRVTAKATGKFEERKRKYISNVPDLNYLDFSYEKIVGAPSSFLNLVATRIGLSQNHPQQSDSEFYVDPSRQHIVAGNPMRFRGRQRVTYDKSWKKGLSDAELAELSHLIS